jgi:hypothetical protein
MGKDGKLETPSSKDAAADMNGMKTILSVLTVRAWFPFLLDSSQFHQLPCLQRVFIDGKGETFPTSHLGPPFPTANVFTRVPVHMGLVWLLNLLDGNGLD